MPVDEGTPTRGARRGRPDPRHGPRDPSLSDEEAAWRRFPGRGRGRAVAHGEASAGEGSGAGVASKVGAGEGEASLGWSGEADSRRGAAGGDGVEAEALQAGDGRGQGRRLPPIQIHSGRGGETRWIEGGVRVTGDVA